MPQVTVARLEVDEVEPALGEDSRSVHVVVDEFVELAIGEEWLIRRRSECVVEIGMMPDRDRSVLPRRCRVTQTTRVGELDANTEVLGMPELLAMGRDGRFAKTT
jgi:hypothetical protein